MSASPSCPACERIAAIRAGRNPFYVGELSESFAVLHDHQPYRGWVVLLLKDHHEHYGRLPVARQVGLAKDIARAASVMDQVLRPSPRRINFECLGNVMAHVHWHLIPRYDAPADPDPRSPVWVRGQGALECGVSEGNGMG